MSAEDDNFLARWSRRKQAAKAAEPPAPQDEAAPADREPPAGEEAVGAEPAAPLPRIEDLTAASDVTAFLRKGVPEALKTAALRRMWSLDPAIRDHVGLAEYAWDYNAPGSMHGFGPVGIVPPLDRVVSQSTMQEPDFPEKTMADVSEPPATPAPLPRQATLPAGPAAAPSPDVPAEPAPPTEAVRIAEVPSHAVSDSASTSRTEVDGKEKRRDIPPESAAPRHGGALPR